MPNNNNAPVAIDVRVARHEQHQPVRIVGRVRRQRRRRRTVGCDACVRLSNAYEQFLFFVLQSNLWHARGIRFGNGRLLSDSVDIFFTPKRARDIILHTSTYVGQICHRATESEPSLPIVRSLAASTTPTIYAQQQTRQTAQANTRRNVHYANTARARTGLTTRPIAPLPTPFAKPSSIKITSIKKKKKRPVTRTRNSSKQKTTFEAFFLRAAHWLSDQT